MTTLLVGDHCARRLETARPSDRPHALPTERATHPYFRGRGLGGPPRRATGQRASPLAGPGDRGHLQRDEPDTDFAARQLARRILGKAYSERTKAVFEGKHTHTRSVNKDNTGRLRSRDRPRSRQPGAGCRLICLARRGGRGAARPAHRKQAVRKAVGCPFTAQNSSLGRLHRWLYPARIEKEPHERGAGSGARSFRERGVPWRSI